VGRDVGANFVFKNLQPETDMTRGKLNIEKRNYKPIQGNATMKTSRTRKDTECQGTPRLSPATTQGRAFLCETEQVDGCPFPGPRRARPSLELADEPAPIRNAGTIRGRPDFFRRGWAFRFIMSKRQTWAERRGCTRNHSRDAHRGIGGRTPASQDDTRDVPGSFAQANLVGRA